MSPATTQSSFSESGLNIRFEIPCSDKVNGLLIPPKKEFMKFHLTCRLTHLKQRWTVSSGPSDAWLPINFLQLPHGFPQSYWNISSCSCSTNTRFLSPLDRFAQDLFQQSSPLQPVLSYITVSQQDFPLSRHSCYMPRQQTPFPKWYATCIPEDQKDSLINLSWHPCLGGIESKCIFSGQRLSLSPHRNNFGFRSCYKFFQLQKSWQSSLAQRVGVTFLLHAKKNQEGIAQIKGV